jgi:hypothetical protein
MVDSLPSGCKRPQRVPTDAALQLDANSRLVHDVDQLLGEAALLPLASLLMAAERKDRLALHAFQERREGLVDREDAEDDANPAR